MRSTSIPLLSFSLVFLALLVACGRHGEGDSCSVASDCEPSLSCVVIPGYTPVGKCCPPNSQCGNSQIGFMLNQDGSIEPESAGIDGGGIEASDAESASDQATDAAAVEQ
jgi:hypothetical protein